MRMRFFHIFLVFAFLSFFSCSKELSYEGGTPITGNPGPPPVTTGQDGGKDTFYVTINGQKFVAQNITATAISFSSQLVVTGSAITGFPTVGLTLSSTVDISGSPYTLGSVGSANSGLYIPANGSLFYSATGQLQILENDATTKRVKGNFNFQAADPTGMSMVTPQLTLGYFSVIYN